MSGLSTKNLRELNKKSAMSSCVDAIGGVLDKERKKQAAVFQLAARKAGKRMRRKRLNKSVDIAAKGNGVKIKRIIEGIFVKESGLADGTNHRGIELHKDHPF